MGEDSFFTLHHWAPRRCPVPWSEISPMSQRQDFIELYLQRQRSIRELCVMFGVSEKTGYKWLRRYHAEGGPGLADRSRAPLSSPQRLSADVLERIVALRQRHPTYGARKLREMLHMAEPAIA